MARELGQDMAGSALSFPSLLPAWLRDNCQCASCRDPVSGQRLISISEQPGDVTLDRVIEVPGGLQVTFGPEGHQSVFTWTWLTAESAATVDERCEDAKQLWCGSDFTDGPPSFSWRAYAARDEVRLSCLRHLLTSGCVLLREVPCQPGAVLAVAGSIGYVRETNYGKLFDVRVEASPANLAFTGLPIGPHTDNPYRDPVPTVQLLHCLVNAADGGDSGVLDGFRAASVLRAEDPGGFAVLSQTPVTFAYADATAELRATRPMIEVDPASRIRGIRYNGRSMQPVRPAAGRSPAEAADDLRAFYAAYRAFADVLARPSLTVTVRLDPGDCLVFDNTRILHSRTGFAATGNRHLQGCYADLDGAESTAAVLARNQSRPGRSGP